jgi:alkanesulfonate monooxygenase SsuD/methylene tetrahydromethanopterin reductase-like flavin-dependent oxidoreductase (luciferase family)
MLVDVQPIPAVGPWQAHVEAVLAAEEAGFSAAWVLDHFTGTPFGGTAMPECFVQLAALAQATTTIGLGTLVANVFNRSAALLAHAAASVQHLSGGRLLLGLGAGASPNAGIAFEQRVIGQEPLPTLVARHDHLLATMAAVRRQWRHAPGEPFDGFTRPEPEPPLVLGVNSTRLARLAGAHADGINIRWDSPERDACVTAAVEARAGSEGWWTTSVWAPWDEHLCDADHPTRQELAAAGVDRLVLMWTDPPSPDAVRRAGARLG